MLSIFFERFFGRGGGELMFESFWPRRVKSVIFLIFCAKLIQAIFSNRGKCCQFFSTYFLGRFDDWNLFVKNGKLCHFSA